MRKSTKVTPRARNHNMSLFLAVAETLWLCFLFCFPILEMVLAKSTLTFGASVFAIMFDSSDVSFSELLASDVILVSIIQ